MKKFLVVVAGLTLVAASRADAQTTGGGLAAPVCTVPAGSTAGQRVAQDACQQAYDVYQFMAPQLGTVLAGGNATLGQGSTMGGLGHFSLGVRVNAVQGDVPKVDQFTQRTTGATPAQTLATKSQILPAPTADLAVGLFGGLPLALTNVGGIDLLVSATYIPTVTSNNVTVTPSSNVQLGYGARIGLLSESIIVPGVALTYIKRDLPTTSIVGTASYVGATTGTTTTTLSVNNTQVKTTAWRLVASKSLIFFGLAAGVGQDEYKNAADISATVNSTLAGNTTATIPNTSQTLKRTNYFVDASMNILLLKLTAEIGQSSGGTVDTYNGFDGGRADKARTYGSVGFRLGL